jgi:hypothetical protein
VLQDAVTAAGGIDAMVQAMQSFPEAVDIQLNCCHAFRDLCDTNADESHICAVGVAGGLNVLISATQRALSADIAIYGCGALRNIGRRGNAIVVAIATGGGFSAIACAMRRYSKRMKVQECGCYTINELCKEAPQTAAVIAAVGGVKLALSAMQSHAESVEVQEQGSAVLSTLSKLHPVALEIRAADGIAVLASAMRRHAASRELRSKGNTIFENIVGRERSVRS